MRCTRLLCSSVALALALAVRPAFAQQSAAPGSISGTAYDSVRNHPMGGARISIEGTTVSTVANADGEFTLDSLAPGSYQLMVSHPVLDSLGISLVTPPIPMAAGQARLVRLATPSSAALVQQLCPAAWLTQGPGALFGRVRNADSGHPIDKARVSLVWTQLEVNGLQKVPHMRAATTSPDGTYRICGLPSTLDGKVQVAFGGHTSGDVPITFDNSVLEMRSLTLGTPAPPVVIASGDTVQAPQHAAAATAAARLSGKVLNVAGTPVAGARVQVEGTLHVATTNADGSFEIDSLPSGSQVVIARSIGFNPVEQAVELSRDSQQNVTLRFQQSVTLLPVVTTQAQRQTGLAAVGFTNRQKAAMGFFLTPQQVDARQPLKLTDLLNAAPGFRVQTSGTDVTVFDLHQTGTSCVNYIVDGTPWVAMTPTDVNEFIQPQTVGAMEFYHAGDTPAEFIRAGSGSGCATIVIWTKWRLNKDTKK